MKVSFYTTTSGRVPVLEYVNKLAKVERARVLALLDQIEHDGLDTIGVQFRQIDGKLWEIKLSAHRIFYVLLLGQEMVLLHAYRKQGQKMPLKERSVALKRIKEVFE